jgi:hypothetical protein
MSERPVDAGTRMPVFFPQRSISMVGLNNVFPVNDGR